VLHIYVYDISSLRVYILIKKFGVSTWFFLVWWMGTDVSERKHTVEAAGSYKTMVYNNHTPRRQIQNHIIYKSAAVK
jgi:hypothetical protein